MARKLSFIVVLLLVTIIGPARGQTPAGDYRDITTLPDTPAGRRVGQLLEVLNSGELDAVRRFVESSFSPAFREAFALEDHLSVFVEVRQQSGGFDFHSIREYTDPRPENQIVAIVRQRDIVSDDNAM